MNVDLRCCQPKRSAPAGSGSILPPQPFSLYDAARRSAATALACLSGRAPRPLSRPLPPVSADADLQARLQSALFHSARMHFRINFIVAVCCISSLMILMTGPEFIFNQN